MACLAVWPPARADDFSSLDAQEAALEAYKAKSKACSPPPPYSNEALAAIRPCMRPADDQLNTALESAGSERFVRTATEAGRGRRRCKDKQGLKRTAADFSTEKSKTLYSCVRGKIAAMASIAGVAEKAKVLWFFGLKKKTLASTPPHPPCASAASAAEQQAHPPQRPLSVPRAAHPATPQACARSRPSGQIRLSHKKHPPRARRRW